MQVGSWRRETDSCRGRSAVDSRCDGGRIEIRGKEMETLIHRSSQVKKGTIRWHFDTVKSICSLHPGNVLRNLITDIQIKAAAAYIFLCEALPAGPTASGLPLACTMIDNSVYGRARLNVTFGIHFLPDWLIDCFYHPGFTRRNSILALWCRRNEERGLCFQLLNPCMHTFFQCMYRGLSIKENAKNHKKKDKSEPFPQ